MIAAVFPMQPKRAIALRPSPGGCLQAMLYAASRSADSALPLR
jgi:hypothetical protein